MNLFTTTQAAAATGLSLKAVQKAIDSNVIPIKIVKSGRGKRRYLSSVSLLCLQLEASGLRQLPLSVRRQIFESVCRMPQVPQIKITDVFLIDVGIARRQLAQRLNELRKAEHMVISDKNIMGGTPVFRGTRVPVHAIAEMIHAGASIREIIEGYPSLNTENVNLALVYAKAHPRRGRPRTQRWSKYIRVKRIRKRLRRAA